jgi:hypothetical protein
MLVVSLTVAATVAAWPTIGGFGLTPTTVEVESAGMAVPLREIDWVAAVRFRLLSVSTNDSANEPVDWGLNARLRLQLVPAVTVPLSTQSDGLPPPATWRKSGGAVKPEEVKVNTALPSLLAMTDCALLVEPARVAGNASAGGSAKSSFATTVVLLSLTKRFPLPSSATPTGCGKVPLRVLTQVDEAQPLGISLTAEVP